MITKKLPSGRTVSVNNEPRGKEVFAAVALSTIQQTEICYAYMQILCKEDDKHLTMEDLHQMTAQDLFALMGIVSEVLSTKSAEPAKVANAPGSQSVKPH